MRLRTLGGLLLDGASFTRPKPLLLLTYLALEGARDRHHLAELFWPDAADGMSSLRVALAQLRAAAPGALEEGAAGLAARLECDAVRLLAALDADDHAAVAELYRGAFLAGFYLAGLGAELEEWIYTTREVLADRTQEALLRQAEREAAGGGFEMAARRAEAALDLAGTPGPERIERLHRVLVAAGRPGAAALARAAAEYGLALDLAPREAQELLLSRGEAPAVPHNLPTPPSSFVGRDAELVELARLLAEPGTRLVTLTGAGGVGKSRLALEAAHLARREARFRDGVFLVALDALTEPELVPVAIAGAIADATGLAPGKGDLQGEVQRALAPKRILLVLDNFEQLMPGAAFLSRLLRGCPELGLLVTSRERLDLDGEQVLALQGLPLPRDGLAPGEAVREDAVQLFLQRARRARLDFELEPHGWPHVLAICRLTQGFPLGLELAAAWVRLLPPAEIASEIGRDLDFLTAAAPDLAARHRSLRATFEHSWRLLGGAERRVLRQLSVFVGGFTREAAAQVAGSTIPLLASLVDKSLLRVLEDGRFDRHPLLYQYSSEKLAEHPQEAAEAHARHAAWFLRLAEESEANHRGAQQVAWLRRLECERDNLRAALAWTLGGGDPEAGLRLAAALHHFWYYRSHLAEGRRWLERALEVAATRAAWDPLRSRLLSAAGALASQQGDDARAALLFEERLELARALGDPAGQAAALNSLGIVAWGRRDYARARARIEASLALRRGLGRPDLLTPALNNLGLIAIAQGKLDEARAYLEEVLALCRELGDEMGTAVALSNLGAAALDAGDGARALALLEEALPRYRALGDQDGLAHCLEGLAAVAALRGRAEGAARLCGLAEALRDAFGLALNEGDAIRRERRLAPARDALGEAAFEAARAAGRGMTLEEGVEAALALAGGAARQRAARAASGRDEGPTR